MRQRIAFLLAVLGWLLFAVSLFCPAVCGTGEAEELVEYGYQCLLGSLVPWAWPFAPQLAFYGLANLALLASPYYWVRLRSGERAWLGVILLLGFLASLTAPALCGGVSTGFYCWSGSFLAVGCGVLLRQFPSRGP
jgi:hypothetical protein